MRFPCVLSVTFLAIFLVTAAMIKDENGFANLSCNFDDGTLCRWRSDSDLWLIGVNVPINSSHFIPHFSNRKYKLCFISDGLYAYARGGKAVLAEGHLISAEVEKYDKRHATLSFNYWKSNNISNLDVCVVQVDAFVCTYTAPDGVNEESRWIKEEITLPNNLSTPFKVVFRARNIHTPSDIVAIDDIQYSNNPSKAFVALISRNVAAEKILSTKQTVRSSCLPVRCTFIDSPCAWTLEAPWHRFGGSIAMYSEGDGLARSGLFVVPAEAFFEMDVWMSGNAMLTVSESLGDKLMIWSAKGQYNGEGWYRLRIPMRASKQLTQLLLKGTVPPNNFIVVSNTKLVNNDGIEISCGVSDANFIKPHLNNTERLTAFQQVHINQVKPTTVILKGKSDRAFINNFIQKHNLYSDGTAFTAPMTNLAYSSAFSPTIKEIQETSLANDRLGQPSRIIDDHIKQQQQQYKLNISLPLFKFRQNGHFPQKSVTFTQPSPNMFHSRSGISLGPFINEYMRSNATGKDRILKELNALLLQVGEQPVLEMQLQQLAQRFGLTQINPEQNMGLSKSFFDFDSKKLQSAAGTDEEQSGKLEPIRPINAPIHLMPDVEHNRHNGALDSLLSLLPVELRKKLVDESKHLFG